MLFLKEPLILPFLRHKSATACQIDSNKVSYSKLKPDLCNCLEIELIESIAPPQQPHKRGTIFFGTACTANSMIKRTMLQGEWKCISTLRLFNI